MHKDKTYLLVTTSSGVKKLTIIFSKFPDGEIHCVVKNPSALLNNSVLIIHDLYPSQNEQMFKLIILVDLLLDYGANNVSFFTPYLPYARQDKRHIEGEAVTANIICGLFAKIGISQLYTFDCHFMKGEPEAVVNGLKIFNLSLGDKLIDNCKRYFNNLPFDVIGPDSGSNYLIRDFGSQSMHKQRGEYGAEIRHGVSHRDVINLSHDHIKITYDNVLVIDDIISTGGTILRAINNLRSRGVKNIYCLAIHGLFLNGSYDDLLKVADKVIVSDTIPSAASIKVTLETLNDEIVPKWIELVNIKKLT